MQKANKKTSERRGNPREDKVPALFGVEKSRLANAQLMLQQNKTKQNKQTQSLKRRGKKKVEMRIKRDKNRSLSEHINA